MTIQWQVLDVHSLRSQLYILKCVNKKHPSACCLAAKHPKHNKWQLQTREKKPVDFFNGTTRALTLAPAINYNLANLGSFAKVSVPV